MWTVLSKNLPRRCPCLIALILCFGACEQSHGITVEFYAEKGYRFSPDERSSIEAIAQAAVPEIRHFLPMLPQSLVLKVYPGNDVIPETGESSSIASTDHIFWIVDARRAEGVIAIAKRELRGTLFHELHHLVRIQKEQPGTLMQRVVAEGLATVFERDAAGMLAPWGNYPPNVAEWTKELLSLPPDIKTEHWMNRHPDGRRWIGYKVGTYIAEQAMNRSGRSSVELVHVSTADVLRMAGM